MKVLPMMFVVGMFARTSLAEGALRDVAPVQSIAAIAWLGGWESLRCPTVAAPTATGESQGNLEKAFYVKWRRDGEVLQVKITKLADAWVGLLAVEFRLASGTHTLVYGDNDTPVRIPLKDAKPGRVLWSWEYGMPSWLIGESERGTSSVILGTATHHGFFLDRYPDGTFSVRFGLDWPKVVGHSVEMSFQLAPGGNPQTHQMLWRRKLEQVSGDPPLNADKLRRVRQAGFVRVDPTGWGFVTGDGKPFHIRGQNTSHLAMLSPAEQEKILAQSEAAGITVTRLLIPDYAYRPLGAWNAEAYRRLKATVQRCASHGIRVVICLEYSGAGDQYNLTSHRTANWSDLYLTPEMLQWYKGTVERVVTPLRDDPAVMSWDVTNEPDIALSPATRTLTGAWHAWLQSRYSSVDAIRKAWGKTKLTSFDAAQIPPQEDYNWQRTQAAKDFFAFGGEAVGKYVTARAKLVRTADPNHLITVSAWDPRLLRGVPDADVFDYWAPHSYEIYFVGPEISDQVAFQVGVLRQALPDRPRPVVIEEFGLVEYDPKFPESVKAEHCRRFLEAGERWDAGIMIWSDLSPPLVKVFAEASRQNHKVQASNGPLLAFYIPPSEECRVLVYNMYMWRRKWGLALAAAREAGFQVREAVKPGDAAGCKALLVLADSLTATEEAAVRAMHLPLILVPDATAIQRAFPKAEMLSADRAEQQAFWKARLAP